MCHENAIPGVTLVTDTAGEKEHTEPTRPPGERTMTEKKIQPKQPTKAAKTTDKARETDRKLARKSSLFKAGGH